MLFLFVFMSFNAFAQSKGNSNPGTSIPAQIDNLQQQINTIELTPGPKGPQGEQGPAGADGATGDTGTTAAGLQAVLVDLLARLNKWDNQFIGKIVFVSSTIHTGNLGGVAGADQICNDLAFNADLPGEYKAWIATNMDNDPDSRFFRSMIQYKMVNGVKVADSYEHLVNVEEDPSTRALITITETGLDIANTNQHVWTNVFSDGRAPSQVINFNECNNWTNESSDATGFNGLVDDIWNWTMDDRGTDVDACDNLSHLYCFEQESVMDNL